MSSSFFYGAYTAKIDEKNRFVLPQNFRYGLVEKGLLEFAVALSIGGCLAIYKKSDIDLIVEKFRAKQHIAKFQKFFTLFFSTLVITTCDKVGRVTIPSVLKQSADIRRELVLAGAGNKIELWSQESYSSNIQQLMQRDQQGASDLVAEAFALLTDDEKEKNLENAIDRLQSHTVQV